MTAIGTSPHKHHEHRSTHWAQLGVALLTALVAACATPPPTQVIDQAVFIGDGLPHVTSTQAFAGDMTNLAPHESLVVARAMDGSGALSQPTKAELVVVEPILEGQRQSPELALKRCDADSDGVLDRHCPELINIMSNGDVAVMQFVSFESRYTINADPTHDRDYWGTRQTLNTGDAEGREMPVTLKLLTVNHGNKTFRGDMDVYINIPPGVRLGGLRLATKVRSRAGAKAAVDTGMMVLGALTGNTALMATTMGDTFFDDYAPVASDAVFVPHEDPDNRLVLSVSDIEIAPQQGITVEYDAVYAVRDN